MTSISKFLLMAALVASPAISFAQDVMKSTNAQLSEYYKHEIGALEDEIKANKKRQKADPTDTKLKADEQNKKAQLEAVKAKKKAVDAALDAEKDSQKAQRKMQDARDASKSAESKMKAAREIADKAIASNPNNKTYEQLSEQYKNEIGALEDELKANKKRQKANPTDPDLKTEEQTKKAELEALKAKKKTVDNFIKAANDYEKAKEKALSSQQDSEDAVKAAKNAAADADKAVGRTKK